MKLLITCGGTAGHVFPAIAFADQIKSNADIVFVGGSRLEKDIVPKHGFSFTEIPVSRKNPFVLIQSIFMALIILLKQKPDAIFATGGYVTLPVLIVAIFLRKPYFIHEQNLLPGRLNRLFARRAKNVFISFAGSAEYFQRSFLTGNPVRNSIVSLGKEKRYTANIKSVLIFGGSLGSKSLNKLAKEIEAKSSLQVIHISKFKDNIEEDYKRADMVICRAGATSISEILALGMPAILVPYPLAKDNHQEYNAKDLVYQNLAFMLKDQDLSVEKVEEIIHNNTLLKETIHNLEVYKKRTFVSKISKNILKQMELGLI